MKGKYQVLVAAGLTIISAIIAVISIVWVVLEIIYNLVKDTEFAWNSVFALVISILFALLSLITVMVLSDRENRRKMKIRASQEVLSKEQKESFKKEIQNRFKKSKKQK